jgi:hypothetical protein
VPAVEHAVTYARVTLPYPSACAAQQRSLFRSVIGSGPEQDAPAKRNRDLDDHQKKKTPLPVNEQGREPGKKLGKDLDR